MPARTTAATTRAPARTNAPRARMRGDERRAQLLDVARALAGEQGLHAVSIEAVARRAGVTRPIVYDHFADLDALLDAMVEREGSRALAQLVAILSDDARRGRPRDVLLDALRAYLEAVRADPVTWRLVLVPLEGAPAVLRQRIQRGRDTMVAMLARVVKPGLAPGRAPPDPELTARLLQAVAEAAAHLLLTDPVGYPIARLIKQARWMLTQLAPRPRARR